MLTEAYLEPSRTSAMQLFLLGLSHILKTYLIRSNSLQVPFYTQLTLLLKNLNCENFGRKSLMLTIEQFFSKFEITEWNGVITKKKKKKKKCQNIFSRTTVLYLIALKRVRINSYLKYEIVLYQKEKRSKFFQVRTISKDVKKNIVQSFMFLFNLLKSVVLCVKKM